MGRGHRRRRRMGSLQPLLVASRLSGLRRLLLRPAGAGDPLHQADRGPGRVERRHRRRHARPRRGRTPTRAEVGVGAVRGGALPGRRRARQRRPSHPPRARSATGGADRRDAGDVRGHRPRAAGPAAGGAQPGARRRAHRRDGAATTGPSGACADSPEAGPLPVVPDRPGPRPPRPRDRRRAAQAAPGPGDRLALPVAGHRLPGAGGGACAPGLGVAGQRERPHRVRVG